MIDTFISALRFLTRKERVKYFYFLFLRSCLALLDLVSILAIGLLATQLALFVSIGSSEGPLVLGPIQFPNVLTDFIPIMTAVIILVLVIKAFLSILLTKQLAYFLARIEARAARGIAARALGNGLESARKNSSEEVLFAVQVGSPSAFNSMLNSLGSIFAEGSLFILVLTAFAFVNPAIAIAAVLYFGLIGILIQTFLGRVMNRTSAKINSSTVDANTQITDIGQVQRELTTLGTQDYFYDRIYETRLSAAKSTAMQNVLNGLPRHIVETSLIVGLAVFIISESTSGNLVESAATLAIFLSGGLRLTASLLPLQSALLSIKQSVPAAKRALAFLEDKGAIPIHNLNARSVSSIPVSIDVKDLSFSFHDSSSEVLTGISMSVPPGSQIALIGASGAGKSTLADLILGLLRPSSGQIRVDNRDPYELLRTSPGQLGYVPQRPGMVSGTIAQNIALGVPQDHIDHQRLNSSLVDSNLMNFIDSLPDGINTNLGKRRDELSGGQLQRIGLARALYSNPRLLVMDEATSALDAESENEINVALDLLRGKVTVVLIAHRLNTIQRSDIVYFIEQGRIVAKGSFSHLLKTSPTVRNLAKLMSINTESEQS